MDEPLLNAKFTRTYGPACPTGRHNMPHPGDTCDEADDWINLRDELLRDMARQLWAQHAEPAMQRAELAATAFAAAVADPIPPPERTDIQRALDILAPHLAWDQRYRA
jgi:hypothetical protein